MKGVGPHPMDFNLDLAEPEGAHAEASLGESQKTRKHRGDHATDAADQAVQDAARLAAGTLADQVARGSAGREADDAPLQRRQEGIRRCCFRYRLDHGGSSSRSWRKKRRSRPAQARALFK